MMHVQRHAFILKLGEATNKAIWHQAVAMYIISILLHLADSEAPRYCKELHPDIGRMSGPSGPPPRLKLLPHFFL
jgi:hypothetical protein